MIVLLISFCTKQFSTSMSLFSYQETVLYEHLELRFIYFHTEQSPFIFWLVSFSPIDLV